MVANAWQSFSRRRASIVIAARRVDNVLQVTKRALHDGLAVAASSEDVSEV